MTVGQRIKQKRESLNLSQGDLAKKMNISRQAVSKAELHDDNITTDKVSKFAEALGVSEAYLMGWEIESSKMTMTIEKGLKRDSQNQTLQHIYNGLMFKDVTENMTFDEHHLICDYRELEHEAKLKVREYVKKLIELKKMEENVKNEIS